MDLWGYYFYSHHSKRKNEKANSTITIEMKIGVFILWVFFTVVLTYAAAYMAIKCTPFRNPFKDKWGSWKDDVSRKEQIIWNFFIIVGGSLFANILRDIIFN